MMNSLEIKDKKEIIKRSCEEIINKAKEEIRELTPEELNILNGHKDEIRKLNDELEEINTKLDNTNKKSNITMKKEFRLLKAINDIANNRSLDAESLAVSNMGTEEMRKAGLSFGGQIQLPMNELRADITIATEHDDVVEVEMENILEPLRAKNVLVNAGARFLTGLVGDVQVPSMSAGNVAWEGEVAPAKDANYAFTSVKLQPKRLTAYVDISKQFLVQDSLSAEALIRQDMINAINSKLEATILGTGEGSPTEPSGLFKATVDTTINDFKGICDLEASVEDANIMGECKYIMSNKAKAAFRNMAKSTKSTQLVMENGEIDGTPVHNTSNVPEKYVAYGDFSNLAIGQWGSLDLTIDPFTLAKDGKVRIVINAFFDAKVLRPEAIKVAKVA